MLRLVEANAVVSIAPSNLRRIAIIGNGGGGKTTLARILGDALDLPVHHVDSIQFQPGWGRTPRDECDAALDTLARGERWIIDGFGGDEVIARRLRAADTVVFVDFALAMHYWWACKRQWQSRLAPRAELPADCPEFTLGYSWRLFKVMWEVHRDFRPWLLNQLGHLDPATRIVSLRHPREWNRFAASCREVSA